MATFKFLGRWNLHRKQNPEVVTVLKDDEVLVAGDGASSAGVSTGGVASNVLEIEDESGNVYYIPLYDSNADAA